MLVNKNEPWIQINYIFSCSDDTLLIRKIINIMLVKVKILATNKMNKKPYTYITSPLSLNLLNAKILQLREEQLTSTACDCYQES